MWGASTGEAAWYGPFAHTDEGAEVMPWSDSEGDFLDYRDPKDQEHNSFFWQIKQMKVPVGRWHVEGHTDDSGKRRQGQFVRQLVVAHLGRSSRLESNYLNVFF